MYLPDSIGLGNLAMLHLSSPVRRIEQSSEGVQVFTDQLTVEARRVIVATPPFLAESTTSQRFRPRRCNCFDAW